MFEFTLIFTGLLVGAVVGLTSVGAEASRRHGFHLVLPTPALHATRGYRHRLRSTAHPSSRFRPHRHWCSPLEHAGIFTPLGSISGVLLGLHWGSKAPQCLTRFLLSLFLIGIGTKLIGF